MIPIKPKNVTWTDEQWEAIYEENKNIIVSAGAGSGKTAVLTERVIRKLKDGVGVNHLLILTFTKAAAGEMADRIRSKIKKIPELKDQLNLLDSSYITTFDSFALSIVKKYNYLLNVSSNIGVIDSSVIMLEKKRVLDNIFNEYYETENEVFLNFIKTFCTKDDTDIKNLILSISNKLDLLSDKEKYLNNYLDKYFKEEKIKNDIDKYFNLIKEKIALIFENVNAISMIDSEYGIKLKESLNLLEDITNYDEVLPNLNIKMPMAPRGSDDELKRLKVEISDILKSIKALAVYENTDEIISSIESTRPTISILIEIMLKFTKEINLYKEKNNSYEFTDIAILAIKVVRDNEGVRNELRYFFNEIMIDEYQDTNDLQEEFISMIANNNVYMVGDIKQSIYRFRNANPDIFKMKYDKYSSSDIDKKIDLNKNFRSRSEVLEDINKIFTLIMDIDIGGADYLESHQMIFGNKAYLKEDTGHTNNTSIYRYNYDKELGFTKEEIEAFVIAKDIINKVSNHYKVFDKDTGILRDANYKDFAIIMDRATSFDLYKKIFNYFKIPLTLLKNEKMNDEDDILVIRNIIRFLIKIKKLEYDTEFRYLYTSISRSYLIESTDNEIFEVFVNNTYKETNLYKKCLSLISTLDVTTPHKLLDDIVDTFSIYEKYLTIGNIYNGIVKISKLRELAINLESLGYDIYEFSNYLKDLFQEDLKMEYEVPDNGVDAVKIMTIHKSKGLEYPVCYFSGLYKSFNIRDLNEKFLYDKDYGLIVPYFKEGIGETIYKELLKNKYLEEEISEKIRLFYVALTRAREKIILVMPDNDKEDLIVNDTLLSNLIKKKYRKLSDLIDSIRFRLRDMEEFIDLDNLGLSKDYAIIKSSNYKEALSKNKTDIGVREVTLDSEKIESKSFSKKSHNFITLEQYEFMELGTKLHEYLEFIDLKNPDYSVIKDSKVVDIIKDFLTSELVKNIEKANIYQEYEFIYDIDNTMYHGIIDLMLEYDDHIDIIDYKLKNIDDGAYDKQLKGYYDFIKKSTSKEIRLYLYSLMGKNFREIKL